MRRAAIATQDVATGRHVVSSEYRQLMGMAPDAAMQMGLDFLQYVAPVDRERVKRANLALRSGELQMVSGIMQPAADVRPVSFEVAVVRGTVIASISEMRKPVYRLGIVYDLSPETPIEFAGPASHSPVDLLAIAAEAEARRPNAPCRAVPFCVASAGG